MKKLILISLLAWELLYFSVDAYGELNSRQAINQTIPPVDLFIPFASTFRLYSGHPLSAGLQLSDVPTFTISTAVSDTVQTFPHALFEINNTSVFSTEVYLWGSEFYVLPSVDLAKEAYTSEVQQPTTAHTETVELLGSENMLFVRTFDDGSQISRREFMLLRIGNVTGYVYGYAKEGLFDRARLIALSKLVVERFSR